jgi:hypothetical protein
MNGYHFGEQMRHSGGSSRSSGRSSSRGTTRTIPAQGKGKPAISFKEGGLHASTGTKPGQKISASEHAKAKSGALGPKAKKQEMFYENVLRKGGR